MKDSLVSGLPHEDYHNIYVFYRNKVSNCIKYYKKHYFHNLFRDNKNNSKYLCRILSSVVKHDLTLKPVKSDAVINIENIIMNTL